MITIPISCVSKLRLLSGVNYSVLSFPNLNLTRKSTLYVSSRFCLKYSNACEINSLKLNSFVSNPCFYSSENIKDVPDNSQKVEQVPKVSQRTKLKQAVKDYGATIIVFHVAISLASLGICYLAISNGVDAVRLLTFLGFSESVITSKVAVGGSTFVIAYAVHKVFAPVRIGITLSAAPFIVRYLRKINLLKPPKKKN